MLDDKTQEIFDDRFVVDCDKARNDGKQWLTEAR